DRFQVVFAADFGLGAVLEGAEELCHGTDESVGKPDLLPAWLDPAAGEFFGGEVEGAGSFCRIGWPADGAPGQAVRPLDAPANIDVAWRAFPCRSSPDIVPARGPAAVVVLKDVEIDAVGVAKTGARIRPRAGQDTVGRAEPVTEGIQVVY